MNSPRRLRVRLHVGLLHVVEALVVGLPDIDLRARQRAAVRVEDATGHQARLALAVQRDQGAELAGRRLDDVEWTQHGRLRRTADAAVVDRLDQHRDTQDVGEQDQLLSLAGAPSPGIGEEIDGSLPLGPRQLDLLDEVVQMADQLGEHLPQSWIGCGTEALGHDLGRTVLGEVLGLIVMTTVSSPVKQCAQPDCREPLIGAVRQIPARPCKITATARTL